MKEMQTREVTGNQGNEREKGNGKVESVKKGRKVRDWEGQRYGGRERKGMNRKERKGRVKEKKGEERNGNEKRGRNGKRRKGKIRK